MRPLLQDLPELPCDFEALRDLAELDEVQALERLLPLARLELPEVGELAVRLVASARHHRYPAFNDFLATWRLSSEEGRALLTLAETLLRIPDKESANRLINDLVSRGNWQRDQAPASTLVHVAGLGLRLGKRFIQEEEQLKGTWHALLLKMGDAVFRRAIEAGLQLLAGQFVLGEDMGQALARRKAGLRYSFDRLGEAAQTADDTRRFFQAYRDAIEALAGQGEERPLLARDGISIKLSALHPRVEYAQWDRLQRELLPRLRTLAEVAFEAGIPITLDAEESERLELTLAIYSEMARLPALRHWGGLGLAVQAYQKRAPAVLDLLARIAGEFRHPVPVRLVKGAYWDSEIKRAQQLGLAGYPVYTRKAHTDLAYLACAHKMLANHEVFFPQFATHNAHTLAWLEACARHYGADYEVQKLVGMGDAVHAAFQEATGRPLRVYAPVGTFHTLLPYLVRRLLENGSSQSFVNQLIDRSISDETLVQDPLARLATPPTPHPRLPSPRGIFADRPNSPGIDPADVRALMALKNHLPKFPPVTATSLVAADHSLDVPAEKRFNPAFPGVEIGTRRQGLDGGL